MLPFISLAGNLVADPDLRFTAAGAAIAKLRVAANERVRDEDGTWRDGAVCFISVVVFGKKAEAVAELTKGTPVMVTGVLNQRQWETSEGEKRTDFEVKATEIAAVVRGTKVDPGAGPGDHGQEESPPF